MDTAIKDSQFIDLVLFEKRKHMYTYVPFQRLHLTNKCFDSLCLFFIEAAHIYCIESSIFRF